MKSKDKVLSLSKFSWYFVLVIALSKLSKLAIKKAISAKKLWFENHFYAKIYTSLLLYLCQIFIFLLGHLHFFLQFSSSLFRSFWRKTLYFAHASRFSWSCSALFFFLGFECLRRKSGPKFVCSFSHSRVLEAKGHYIFAYTLFFIRTTIFGQPGLFLNFRPFWGWKVLSRFLNL